MNIYMEVSSDKYEFPLEIASSIKELSQKCNVSEVSIRSAISKAKNGRIKKSRFVCVNVED